VNENPLSGYVIASGIEANGRLLGLVFTGATGRADGERVFVDNTILDQSVNVALVVEGLAYVEPYDTMPMSLVKHLRGKAHAARNANAGLWKSEDVTTEKAALIQTLAELEALVRHRHGRMARQQRQLAAARAIELAAGRNAHDDGRRSGTEGRHYARHCQARVDAGIVGHRHHGAASGAHRGALSAPDAQGACVGHER
jgi:hypothetical protein